jgi:ABC-type transport system substrate-binding protein
MTHSYPQPRRKAGTRRWRFAAVSMISLGLVAAACGGDDDEDTVSDSTTATTVAATTAGSTASTAPANTEAEGTDTTAAGDTETTAGTEPTDTEATDTTEATEATEPTDTTGDTSAAAEPDPNAVAGGRLVMGVEADTSSPWRPAEMVCAISCHQIIRNIYDTLTMATENGGWTPYVAESVEPNEDFTEWRITAREGVTFHDGTPFDGAAIVDNLTRVKEAGLTGRSLAPVETIEVDPADPMVAVVTMNTPWAAFPITIAGQPGYQASPTWLAASDTDETLRARPVGTGPFVYKEYRPNETFVATKNADYWNQPYPYLDEIEFRPIPDALNRRDALKSGTIDLMHTTNGETIAEFRETDEFKMEELTEYGETAYTLLHVTQEGSALQDRRVRCALGYAQDQQALIDTVGAGIAQIANGPFSPEQVGYLEDTGYPMEQDMEQAQALIAEYKAENPGPINLSLATTQDQTNLTVAQFQQQWFTEAGIDNVTIDQIDQGAYIVAAVLGNFQVFQWRNHGGIDLDAQYVWWHSTNSQPVGELALNFGRINDPELDALLDENRASGDPERKREIAEEVNRLFARECYNLWGSYTVWAIAAKPNVNAPARAVLPNGEQSLYGSGQFSTMAIWVEQ